MGTTQIIGMLLLGLSALSETSWANPWDKGSAHATNQAWMMGYMAGKSKDESKSKTYKYMAMMQMMQANATALAGKQSRQSEKKDEAKASPTPSPSAELQIAKLEIPKQAEEKPLVDLSQIGKKIPTSPLPAPPIPSVSPGAALQIVASFVPAAAKPAAPKVKDEPQVVPPTKPAASKLPPSIEQAPPGEKLGYDGNLGDRNVASLPAAANVIAAPGAGNVNTPIVATGNITEPPGIETGRKAFREPPDNEGASRGGGTSDSGRGRGDGFGDLLGDLMALKVPAAQEEEIVMPEKQENPGSNIFEYASYRYRHTETSKKKLKKKT